MAKTTYVWDELSDSVIEEYEDGVLSVSYTHEPGLYGNLLSQNRNGVTSYYHYDGRGDTVALTNDSGDVTDTKEYDAWGNVIASTGSTVTPYQFVGRSGYQTSNVPTFAFVRERTYSPQQTRWLSPDPLTLSDGVNNFLYASNNPLLYIDPSGTTGVCASLGYPMFEADIVAKSFINGLPTIGTLNVPANFTGVPWPRTLFPFDPFSDYYPGSGANAGTARLNLFAKAVRRAKLAAFFQNPLTDVKNGLYRLYTRAVMQFSCCGDKLACVETQITDMEGGLEFPATFVNVPTISIGGKPVFVRVQITPDIYGTINMSPVHLENRTNSSVDVWWTGWGRPNRLAEPGMQAVGQRTSTNIWHSPDVRLSCENGQGKYQVLDPQTAVSRFPSHRIWVNGAFEWGRPQKALADLWTSSPARPDFVIEREGSPVLPRF
jgi:RHS repeat-associated protein